MAPSSEPLAIVKADAYGHGAARCASALYEAGARRFGVAHIAEAVEVRRYVGDSDILILGHTPPQLAPQLCGYNITQNVYSAEYAHMLSEYVPAGAQLKIHLKIDTGMNRLGFSCDEKGISEAAEAARDPHFYAEGAFSHFACADEPEKEMTARQLERFSGFISALHTAGVDIKLRHIAASSAIINFPQTRLEIVRPGVILYGMQPSDTMTDIRSLGLAHVMTLRSRVTNLHTVCAGETVSYGASYHAERDITAATVPIGYGDGFVRAYSSMSMMINGKKYPIIGRICMDQCMLDVTGGDVSMLDEVDIFCEDNPVEAFAAAAHTIDYECTCILTPRVKREYIG